MSEKLEMTLGVSLLLGEITEKILYKVEEVNGEKVVVDRDVPFRLRYRLNKNRVLFNKDAQAFNQRKLMLLAQYGEPSEDGQNVVIKDEGKMTLYREAIGTLIDSTVEHNIMTLEPEDIELIKDTDILVSPDAMTLFIGYMTNDPEFDREISSEVKITPPKKKEEKKEEEVPVEVKEPVEEVKKDEDLPKVEEVKVEKVEEVPVEEAPKKKKTSTRKKSTKKEGSEGKDLVEGEEKSPAKKKATSKKKGTSTTKKKKTEEETV